MFLGAWDGWYWMDTRGWTIDLVVGFATTCLLVFCTGHLVDHDSEVPPRILRMLQAKPLVILGGYSYSCYLVHDLILNAFYMAVRPVIFGPQTLCWLLLGAGILLSLAGAYVFHLFFERPFMHTHPRKAEHVA